MGYMEDSGERMVRTPWSEGEMPFRQAAELGTDKVIRDHSTIGVLVTTDGSIGDISREAYVKAEERVASALADTGKPYVILLNTTAPESASSSAMAIHSSSSAKDLPSPCIHSASNTEVQLMPTSSSTSVSCRIRIGMRACGIKPV